MPEHEPLKIGSPNHESDGGMVPLDMFDTERSADTPEEAVDAEHRSRQKTLAEHALRNAPGEKTEQLETLSAPEALSLLFHEYGFYPHDNEEKNAMTAVLGRSDEFTPLISYFSDISKRRSKQFDDMLLARKKEDLPSLPADEEKKERQEYQLKALRSRTNKIIGYASDAVGHAAFGNMLGEQYIGRYQNSRATFASVFSKADVRQDEMLSRGFTALAHRAEVKRFAKGNAENPLGKNQGLDSVQGNARIDRIFADLGDMTLEEVCRGNQAFVLEEARRFAYWRSQLEQAALQMGLTGQAREGLGMLRKKSSNIEAMLHR